MCVDGGAQEEGETPLDSSAVRQYAMLTQCQIFKDIIPSYKIKTDHGESAKQV